MARDIVGRLLPLGIVGGIGWFLYSKGEADAANGQTTGLASFAKEIDSVFGNINKSGSGTSGGSSGGSSGAPAGGGGGWQGTGLVLGSDGVFHGSAAQITAMAQANGVKSAADPRADAYGALLWSQQSGQPASAFAGQSQATRATFDSVAVAGS